MAIHEPRRLLFRIFYSTTFTVFFLILVSFILVSPADAIWQSYNNRRYLTIFIIAGVYVLTGLLAVLVLASRLYTNRSVLQSIPKTYMPIESEDLGKKVRKLVKEGIDRNALIAYNARPKYISEEDMSHGRARTRHLSLTSTTPPQSLQWQARDKWAKIQHPGWSSPYSTDLPNLQYDVVIEELPSLIEAKAVSLAPPQPNVSGSPAFLHIDREKTVVPDPRFVDVLQRSEKTSFREYIERLSSLDLVEPAILSEHFLQLYEFARFSGIPLTDKEFRRLMSIFAEILRSLNHLSPRVISEATGTIPHIDDSAGSEGYETPSPRSDHSSEHTDARSLVSISTENSTGTQRRHPVDTVSEVSATDSYHSLRTAPLTQRSASRYTQARSSSGQSVVRRLPSGASLRPTRSNVSNASHNSAQSGGSVIRLAGAHEGPLDLPYVIDLQGGRP